MNEFFTLWKQRAEAEPGDYLINLFAGNNIYVYVPASLSVAVAYAETLATDYDFDPKNIEITMVEITNSKFAVKHPKRIAVAKDKPSNFSPVHSGYVIWFGVTKHKILDKYWEVYLT